jgi:Ger(x)C family germination protein
MAILIAFLLLTGVLTTVGGAKDINERLIATTISVDKKDGEIWFYTEFANVRTGQSGSSGTGNAPSRYVLVKGRGGTLSEARSNLNRQLDMPIYLSGARTLLITENFAKEHLTEYLYRLRADETYRKKVITVITRDDLDTLYETLGKEGESVGYSIENTIRTLDDTGDCFSRTTSRLLENLSEPYTGILIPCVGLEDKEIALTGYSVVNDTRVIGFIPIESCKGLTILKAERAKAVYVVPYQKDSYTVDTTLTGRGVKAFYEDGRPSYQISLSFDATLEYGDGKVPYGLGDAAGREMTSILEQMISRDARDAIDQAQTAFRTDYLQFDDAFRVAYPVIFDSLDWNTAFAQAAFSLKVKVNLDLSSMIDYGVENLG